MGTKEAIIEGLESGVFKTQREAANFYKVSEAYASEVVKKHKGRKPRGNSDFDAKYYIASNLEKTLKKLVDIAQEKGTARHIELALKVAGLLVEKREETHRVELGPSDYTRIARETINGLREEYRAGGGCCPVCGFIKSLPDSPRLCPEPEQPEDREVATVALSDRPE